jgi:hypothetical protein
VIDPGRNILITKHGAWGDPAPCFCFPNHQHSSASNTYARGRINSLLGERWDEGRAVIERMLENRSSGKKIDAGFRDCDKALFNQVKDAINTVHHELGHGDNRWGLVQVYMS